MKIARLPLLILPFVALAIIAFLAVLITAMVDQVHLRGAYQVWQENETFAAATVALLAAMIAARPVYMQVRAQSVQAALDLLHRTEAEIAAGIDIHNRLFALRRAAMALAAEINEYAMAGNGDTADLKGSLGAFLSNSPKELRALAGRPTITAEDRTKIIALASVLAIAQQAAGEISAHERDGAIPRAVVEAEREFLGVKLAGMFGLATEIAEDIDRQQDVLRERAMQLRAAADGFLT